MIKQLMIKTTQALNTKVMTYRDHFVVYQDSKDNGTGSTVNQPAKQFMWATNQAVSGDGGLVAQLSANRYANLSIGDPQMIRDLFVKAFNMTDPPQPPTDFKIWQEGWSTQAEIHNSGTNYFTLTEYRCRARWDRAHQGASLDNNIITGGSMAAPDDAGLAVCDYKSYGTSIFDLPNCVRDWKVLKTRNWKLKPGDHKLIKYSAKKGRILNLMEQYGSIAAGGPTFALLDAKKGMTFSVFRVQPGWSGTNGDALQSVYNHPGIGNAFVGITYQVRIKYRKMDIHARTTEQKQYISGITSGAATAPVIAVHTIQATTLGATAGPQVQDLDQ